MSQVVEEKLGYYFFDKRLLSRALTRKSYALEQPQPCEHQEAYVMLGNAIVTMVLTEALVRAGYQTETELLVKKLELELEREAVLSQVSTAIGLGYLIKLSAAERQQQVEEQPQVLVETLEAAIAAIYFDGGFMAARQAVHRLFRTVLPDA
ncbi:MAG TPA: ribonuclease III domain-containing protein [Microcoleaceae cyanobacterium]